METSMNTKSNKIESETLSRIVNNIRAIKEKNSDLCVNNNNRKKSILFHNRFVSPQILSLINSSYI